MRFILRGRRSIWWSWKVTLVAPCIVMDVSYAHILSWIRLACGRTTAYIGWPLLAWQFSQVHALDPLQHLSFVFVCLLLTWLQRLEGVTDAYVLSVCDEGKHQSVYMGRVVWLAMELLKELSGCKRRYCTFGWHKNAARPSPRTTSAAASGLLRRCSSGMAQIFQHFAIRKCLVDGQIARACTCGWGHRIWFAAMFPWHLDFAAGRISQIIRHGGKDASQVVESHQ